MKPLIKQKTWASFGIRGANRFEELFYSVSAKTIVAQFSKDSRVKSLFSRGINDKKYRRLTPNSPKLSYCTPVAVLTRPLLYVNVMRQEKVGGYWKHVVAINLKTRKIHPVITRKDIKPPPPYINKAQWVSNLLGTSADGRHLYCIVGFERKATDVLWLMDYWVCDFDVTRKSLRKISLLLNTFL